MVDIWDPELHDAIGRAVKKAWRGVQDDVRDTIVLDIVALLGEKLKAGWTHPNPVAWACVYGRGLARDRRDKAGGHTRDRTNRTNRTNLTRGERWAAQDEEVRSYAQRIECKKTPALTIVDDPIDVIAAKQDARERYGTTEPDEIAAKVEAEKKAARRRPRVGAKRYEDLQELKGAGLAHLEPRHGRLKFAEFHYGKFRQMREHAGLAARDDARRKRAAALRRRGPIQPPEYSDVDPSNDRTGLGRFLFAHDGWWGDAAGNGPLEHEVTSRIRECAEISLYVALAHGADLWPQSVTASALRKTPLTVLALVRVQERRIRAALREEAVRLEAILASPLGKLLLAWAEKQRKSGT